MRPLLAAFFLALSVASCTAPPPPGTTTISLSHVPVPVPVPVPDPSLSPPPLPASSPVVSRARLEVSRGVTYDSSYAPLSYPGGDPSPDRGVCTDVVIRSLRATGTDLQQLVHEDILRRPSAYTTVAHADRNIDHRRVTPMLVYLRAHATSLPTTFDTPAALATWQPGDVIVWAFRSCPACNPDHVGIVSDRVGARGVPLVLHNIGPVPSEDDRLDAWTVLGHFRVEGAR